MDKEQIKEWLFCHEIENCVINDDLSVDVNDDVILYRDYDLGESFPFQWGVINGYFDCSHSLTLSSYKNFPKFVDGDLVIYSNNLPSIDKLETVFTGELCCDSLDGLDIPYDSEYFYEELVNIEFYRWSGSGYHISYCNFKELKDNLEKYHLNKKLNKLLDRREIIKQRSKI